MSKPMLFMTIVFFIIVTTLLANSLELASMEVVGAPEMPDSLGISTLSGFVRTLFRIMTFSLEGVPALVNGLLFTPIAFGLAYMLIDLIWIG